MKSGLYVRVQTDSPSDAERLHDYLKADNWVSETATLENVLNDNIYHLARISSKLDNLGQLRHLFRIRQIITAKFGDKFDVNAFNERVDMLTGKKQDGE